MKRPESWRRGRKLTTREKADHAISVHDYPELDLDENEYIIIDVERTKLFPILAHTVAIVGYLFFTVVAFLDMHGWLLGIEGNGLFSVISFLVTIILAVVCYLALWIYNRNQMIVSNQRIFDKIQTSLFAYRMQSIELEHIEDLSHAQVGILAKIFNYGSVRFSTVGNEHTYELTFVHNPEEQIRIIKKAVHNVEKNDSAKPEAKNRE